MAVTVAISTAELLEIQDHHQDVDVTMTTFAEADVPTPTSLRAQMTERLAVVALHHTGATLAAHAHHHQDADAEMNRAHALRHAKGATLAAMSWTNQKIGALVVKTAAELTLLPQNAAHHHLGATAADRHLHQTEAVPRRRSVAAVPHHPCVVRVRQMHTRHLNPRVARRRPRLHQTTSWLLIDAKTAPTPSDSAARRHRRVLAEARLPQPKAV